MSDKITNLTTDSFKSALTSSATPVLVDFWAPWCGPCKAIAPIVEELANEYAGRLKVVKLNVDDNQKVAGSFGIRGIPTLLVFKDGQVKQQIVGAVPKGQLVRAVDSAIA